MAGSCQTAMRTKLMQWMKLCLYDGELVDDEMYSLYGGFAPGVRILVFSDSCHSGSVTKVAYYQNKMNMRTSNLDSHEVKYRFMPSDVARLTYRLNKDFYDNILKKTDLKEVEDKVKASVLLISGCQDNQLSQDGDFNGLLRHNCWQSGKMAHSRGPIEDYRRILSRECHLIRHLTTTS